MYIPGLFRKVFIGAAALGLAALPAVAQVPAPFGKGARALARYEANVWPKWVAPGRFSAPRRNMPTLSAKIDRGPGSYAPLRFLRVQARPSYQPPRQGQFPRREWHEFPRRNVFPDKDRVDAVIFDMDGTLLDSLTAWDRAAAKYLLQTYGIELPETVEQEIKQMSLIGGARYIREKFNLPQTPEELLEGTLQQVRQRYLTDISPKPGVRELLQKLQKQGIKISVATASDKELAVQAFERLGLLNYVDFIITCDEVGAGKSSPQVYEAALERLGTQKTRTLVVEDALYALQTAKKAGFLTAGVDDPYHDEQHRQQARLVSDYFFTSFTNSLE